MNYVHVCVRLCVYIKVQLTPHIFNGKWQQHQQWQWQLLWLWLWQGQWQGRSAWKGLVSQHPFSIECGLSICVHVCERD